MGRSARLVVVAILAFAVARPQLVFAAPASYPIYGPPLGVAQNAGTQPTQQLAAAGSRSKLKYHGGPVMFSSEPHGIFWDPFNSSLTDFPAGYPLAIDQYFFDVAHDSGKHTNVYSVATQYFGPHHKHIKYKVTHDAVGTYADTDAFPASGCTVTSPFTRCLTDSQIRTEVLNIDAALHFSGLGDIYFVFLPPYVDTCFDGGGECLSTSPGFCAYHSFIQTGPGPTDYILFANMPFAWQGLCATQEPIGHYADETINVLSHEHNETITDPTAQGWFTVNLSGENGDKCNFRFGRLHGTSGTRYSQTIDHRHYELQEEFSNRPRGCKQHRS